MALLRRYYNIFDFCLFSIIKTVLGCNALFFSLVTDRMQCGISCVREERAEAVKAFVWRLWPRLCQLRSELHNHIPCLVVALDHSLAFAKRKKALAPIVSGLVLDLDARSLADGLG